MRVHVRVCACACACACACVLIQSLDQISQLSAWCCCCEINYRSIDLAICCVHEVSHWFSIHPLDGRRVSLGNILQFFSGANKLPATGFDESPKIAFTSENRIPSTSTCALKITFPRSLALLTYTEFEEKMDFCILDSFGFGSA